MLFFSIFFLKKNKKGLIAMQFFSTIIFKAFFVRFNRFGSLKKSAEFFQKSKKSQCDACLHHIVNEKCQ